jgi:hypothetical protein
VPGLQYLVRSLRVVVFWGGGGAGRGGGGDSNVFLVITMENRKSATANRIYDLENARSHIDIGTWRGMGVAVWGSFV